MEKLKILISGAGIAGLTLSQLLKKQGFNPVIIERESRKSFNSSGYMLGILPLGGRVITELGLKNEYFDQSIEMTNYEIHKENGKLVKAYDLSFISKEFASYRGIERQELIKILLKDIQEESIRFGITLKHIENTEKGVNVEFSDEKTEHFDIVVIAEGMHAQSRDLLWRKDEYKYFDTNWGGWVLGSTTVIPIPIRNIGEPVPLWACTR